MAKRPNDRGIGLIEWILIIILVAMILTTLFLLLRPALEIFWQELLESVQ